MEVLQWCTAITTVIAFGILVWGFMELLRGRQFHETTELTVISRQLRGLGWIMIAPLIILVGGFICAVVSGQFMGILPTMRRALGAPTNATF